MIGNTSWRRVGVLAASGLTLAAVAVGPAAVGAAAAPAPAPKVYGYQVGAIGAQVTNTTALNVGAVAQASISCTGQAGLVRTATAVNAPLGALGSVNGVTDTATTSAPNGNPTSTGTSDVGNVALLAGSLGPVISLDAVHTSAVVSHDTKGYHATPTVTYAGLKVLGVKLAVQPAANTTVEVAGFGTLVLNEQIFGSGNGSLVVNALHLTIKTVNVLNIPVGAQLVIGRATAGLVGPVNKLVSGYAFGTQITSAGLISTTTTAQANVPCTGTGGKDVTASLLPPGIPGILTGGLITSTVNANANAVPPTVSAVDTIGSINILNGLVTGGLIRAKASVGAAGGSTAGSDFANLHVRGFPAIDDDVPANTTITIPGVGTLTLFQRTVTATSATTKMLVLTVTATGQPVPVGAVISVGVATASLVV